MQVFLSYVHQDRDFAETLTKDLSKRGIRVWTPWREILPGENAWLRAGQALEKSDALVVLLSPTAMESEFLRGDIDYALGNTKFEGRVFPVLVRPTKNFPWIFEKFQIYNAKQGVAKIGASIAERLKRVA
jgi:hypothetical protein